MGMREELEDLMSCLSRGQFAGRCLKSSRDFPVTFEELTGTHTSLWCSMMLDFSGELQKDRINT